MEQMLWYTKTIISLVKRLEIIRKCCLSWISLSRCPLLLCKVLKYKISKWGPQNISLKVLFKRYWLKIGLHVDFMTSNILKLDFYFLFFYIPWIHYKLEGTITRISRKHQLNVILSCFKQILDDYLFNISTCILLAPSSKICKLFLEQENLPT